MVAALERAARIAPRGLGDGVIRVPLRALVHGDFESVRGVNPTAAIA